MHMSAQTANSRLHLYLQHTATIPVTPNMSTAPRWLTALKKATEEHSKSTRTS